MADRISALEEALEPDHHGVTDRTGIELQLVDGLELWQVAAWPKTLKQVGVLAAEKVAAAEAPGPLGSVGSAERALLRVEPLKWWILGASIPSMDPELGTCLDLSHSRTRVRISGEQAVALLNRHVPINLSDSAFPMGAVASSAMHHVGVTLWRSDLGYELFIPRGYAVSVWEVLFESALQFGVSVAKV